MNAADGAKQPPSLKDNIRTILHGSNAEKEKIKGQFFRISNTPRFMKRLGLTGEYFSVRYGVIARHRGKDEDHDLTEQNWTDLCKKITDPFAIVKNGKAFKLFSCVKVKGRSIVVCVNVKNIGKGTSINAVATAYGFRNRPITGEIVYRAKKITPEQAALLDRPNAVSLPQVQRCDRP